MEQATNAVEYIRLGHSSNVAILLLGILIMSILDNGFRNLPIDGPTLPPY